MIFIKKFFFNLNKEIIYSINRRSMANSKYEYVKKFEEKSTLLPECYIIIRLDGKNFTKYKILS